MTVMPLDARARIGLVAGPVLFIVMLMMAPPAGITENGWRAAAAGILMAVWWVTEALPIPVTSLLPLVLFPLLGVLTIDAAAAPYANPVIFLFMGGFIIAKALERTGLHKRAALATIRVVGTRPRNLVGGFMAATAFISLWVSNTATVAMMYPMATSVIDLAERDKQNYDPRFAVALLLGLAYSASIGGLGTLIGTPPNALLAGFVAETYGREIGFAQWMLLGVPVVLVGLPITWFVLVRWLHPLGDREIAGGQETFGAESAALGPVSRAQRIVATIAVLTAVCWMTRPLLASVVPGLSDAGIGIAGALLLFLVPVDRRSFTPVLRWEDAERIPWGVLILFGGGLSLAQALSDTGLATWIGNSLTMLGTLPLVVMVAAVTALVLVMTEFTSNTATAAIFLPILGSIAVGLGIDPFILLVPATLAATCAFMLPVGTPPNAIVFAGGRLTIPQMVKAGALVNLVMLVVINAAVFLLAPWVFGAN